MKNTLETTDTPGRARMISKAGRIVSAVVCAAPETIPSAAPPRTMQRSEVAAVRHRVERQLRGHPLVSPQLVVDRRRYSSRSGDCSGSTDPRALEAQPAGRGARPRHRRAVPGWSGRRRRGAAGCRRPGECARPRPRAGRCGGAAPWHVRAGRTRTSSASRIAGRGSAIRSASSRGSTPASNTPIAVAILALVLQR